MLRHQIAEIIRATVDFDRRGCTQKSALEASDHIIELLADETELRHEIAAAQASLPG